MLFAILVTISSLVMINNVHGAIKFFSDYPNSTPLDSDFFVLQRNQSYINSSPAQVRVTWFLNPVFTGNGSISGTFTATTYFGDGSSLTGIPSGPAMTNYVNSVSNAIFLAVQSSLQGAFIPNLNGNGTNVSLWGTTIFDDLEVANAFFTNAFFLHTNWSFIGLDGNGQIVQVNPGTNGVWLESSKVFLNSNTLPVILGDISQTPTHDLHIFHTNSANNDVVGIDSTSTDSSSMFHIKNLTAQGPFFDYESANVRWGFGISSLGPFVLRTSANATDPVNGTTVITWSTNGDIILHGGLSSDGMTNQAFAAIGVVTNDASGQLHTTPTLPNPLLANSSVTINGTAAHITTTSSTVALGGSATLDIGTSVALLNGDQGFTTVQLQTNAVASATNTLSFATEDYTFVSLTAMSITGFSNLPTTNSANILLTVQNTSGTNWNLTIPTTVLTATGTRGSIVVTNGQDRLVWFRYNPGTGHTNLVECPNF